MGQQQLLLIILGVIIVGIAVAVGITMFQDNAVDQNRSAVIADLTTLAAKSQQYYAKPTTLGGGGNSFSGLSADGTGLGILASTAFTTNANGTYSISTLGTAGSVTLKGVGAVVLSDATSYPTYTMLVSAQTQVPTKIK